MMKVKRNAWDLLIWLLFGGVFLAAALELFMAFLSKINQGGDTLVAGVYLGSAYIVEIVSLTALYMGVLFLVFMCYYLLPTGKQTAHDKGKELLFSLLFLLFCIALATGMRVFCLNGNMSLEEGKLFQTARILSGGESVVKWDSISHPGHAYYWTACIMRVLFSFFGNHNEIFLYFQVFLQVMTLVILYAGIRSLYGKLPAMFSTLGMAVSSSYINLIHLQDATNMTLLSFTIGILIGAFALHIHKNAQRKQAGLRMGSLLSAGFLLGVLVYFEVFFIILPLVFFLSFLWNPPREKGCTLQNSLIFLLGSITGYTLLFEIEALVSGYSFVELLMAPWRFLIENFSFAIPDLYPKILLEGAFLLLLLAGIGIVTFWLYRKEQHILYLLLLYVACYSCSFKGTPFHRTLLSMLWLIIGVNSVVFLLQDRKKKEAVTATEIQKDNSVLTQGTEKKEEAPGAEEAEKISQSKDGNIDKKQEIIPPPKDGNAKKEEASKPQEFVPIPNPLPLPKPHVKREMEYGFEPEEKDMHFDIDTLPEEDDFDI